MVMPACSIFLHGLVQINFPVFLTSYNFSSTPAVRRKTVSCQTCRTHKWICIQKKNYIPTVLILHNQPLKLDKANFVIPTFSIVFTYNTAYLFFGHGVGMTQFLNQKYLLSARPLFPLLQKMENEWWMMSQATAWRNRIAYNYGSRTLSLGEWSLLLQKGFSRRVLIVLLLSFISFVLGADFIT